MLAASLAIAHLIQSATPPPNIVYIMADDLGYGEVGCYGQSKIPTPNIDRLAKEGIKMTRSYSASPVCAPTRYSLLTGKHQGHAAIRGNKEKGGFAYNDAEGQSPIAATETTIPEVLKQRGYTTGIVGKWGLGGPQPGESPLDHGFDYFYGYLCQRRAHNFYPTYLWKNYQPDLLGNKPFNAHQKLNSALASDQDYYDRYQGEVFSGEKLTEASLEFIKRSASKPFFLYYAPTLPHVALQAPEEWINKFPRGWDPAPYLGEKGYTPSPRPRATYAAMIAYLDYSIGEVIKALDEAGTAENTLIIVTSDNGPSFAGGADTAFFNSTAGLRGGKMNLYEGGVRVPFVARWPGKIAPGTMSDHLNVCYDALATLGEVAGAKTPRTDGQSYLPALLGRPVKPRPYLYFEYPEASSQDMVMFGDLKVIRPNLKQRPDQFEVYDLSADPGETRNLSASRPDLIARAKVVLRKEHVPNALFPLPGVDTPPTRADQTGRGS